jgi:hypothetical protein
VVPVRLKWAIRSARWLGKNDDAEAWQEFFDDFFADYASLAKNDLNVDTGYDRRSSVPHRSYALMWNCSSKSLNE